MIVFVFRHIVLLAAAGLLVAAPARFTLWSGNPTRRMRWRVLAKWRPGPGFATVPELWWRWGRLSAIYHGKRSRPDMPFWERLITPAPRYARRLGRGTWARRLYARLELAVLVYAPPRTGKTAMVGDWLLDHQGPALVTESRPDLFEATAGTRHQRGPVHVFNPEGVGGFPSTFRWAITQGCEDPAEAIRRSQDLVGAVQTAGDMAWWVEKAGGALAAGLHAAALTGADITAVYAWAQKPDISAPLIKAGLAHPGASMELFGNLAELARPGKTADSIKITMSKSLDWVGVPAIRDMVTGPGAVPFDVGSWADQCGTIYMLAPAGENSPVAPLFRCLASYIHRALRDYSQRLPGRRLSPRMLFLLDELHLCPVDLPHWLADSAGFGIDVVAIVHSDGQLKDKYGEAGLATVLGTTGVKVFLPGIQDADTLSDISRLCGTVPHGENGERPAAPVSFLSRLPNWRALVLNGNLSPVVVKTRPHWRRLGARLGMTPGVPAHLAAYRPWVPRLLPDPETVPLPGPETGYDGDEGYEGAAG